jgi:hypothetical protein
LLRTNVNGELPTHRAGTVEVLEWLGTEAGVPFNQPTGAIGGGSRGQLPVHAAALRGDIAALAW